MKFIKKILVFLLIAFILAQFFGPDKNDGDITSIEPFFDETNPPETVKSVLKETCFDCHSDFTRYPWYNRITPLNYWMADHVRHGRGELNVSKWAEYSEKKKDHKLEEVIDLVKAKEMPLPSYTWAHRDAKLTDEQIAAVVEWAEKARTQYAFRERPQ